MLYRKYRAKRALGHIVSTPFIWAPLVGVVILDILATIYQAICFPLYGLKKVKRSEYIQVMDRAKLPYLNFLEKLSCMYCGYANGFLLYAKEIAGRTEKYWCGIMHQSKPGFKTQASQVEQNFAKFGDEKDFKKKYSA